MNLALAPWVILLAPLLAAIVILFVGPFSKPLSAGIAILSAAVGAVLSWMLFAHSGDVVVPAMNWIDFGPEFAIRIGLTIDHLSKVMLVIVTTIATIVFTYSIGYMKHETGYSRYFAGLSLFLFSMLGIVLADNFVMMFIFWELVGVSSYILIGHYFEKNSAAEAAKQAFTVNRIGDFGFMIGILMLWFAFGTFTFSELLAKAGAGAAFPVWTTVACIFVFCGTVGKSAQMPLHVWLPNSMEGPTPVSSLLHAATMVAAGVYMLARIFPLLQTVPIALDVIAWVGGITCFVAGLMAIQQDDIKRILAYSTISQLGYMVLAIGVAPSSEVAMFHLFNHACFKCMLFLCAGSVILGMHHEQDIWKMGALKNKMPITFLTCAVGVAALCGVPGFSGFFSKDLIIAFAAEKSMPLFWLATLGAVLTAFYMFRSFFVTFFGPPRSEAARHAGESPLVMTIPLIILAIPSAIAGYGFFAGHFFQVPHPHEETLLTKFGPLGAVVVGVVAAFLLYFRAEKDPLRIPFFANRLYIDALYAEIVRYGQDRFGNVLAWSDRWVIGGVVALSAWAANFAGGCLRLLQLGNLQAYAFFFGAGVVGLLYLLLK